MSALVSVVIPCFKGSRFLGEAIQSCLDQTYGELEVIVVDDASPQNDAEIAECYRARDSRVKVLRHAKNGGVSRAYNTGFAAARGDYFTRLSQDDVFREDAFAIMVQRLEAAPQDVGLVYCDMQKMDEDGKFLSTWYQSPDPDKALFPTQEVGLCVMWRRSVSQSVGPFRSRFDFAEDYDFYLRVSRQYRFVRCGDEAPFFFRCHPDQNGTVSQMKQSMTYTLAQMDHNWVRIKEHPFSMRPWKGIVGGTARLARSSCQIRWKALRDSIRG